MSINKSLYCTSKTNTMLYINYISILKIVQYIEHVPGTVSKCFIHMISRVIITGTLTRQLWSLTPFLEMRIVMFRKER